MNAQNPGNLGQFPDAEVIQFAARAAAVVHRQMRQGLNSLATVSSLAPLVGIFGTLIHIPNSFPGFAGQKGTLVPMIFARLAEACAPAALGLLVAVPSFGCYRYLTSRLECMDFEMENASLQLVNLLRVCPVRLAPAARVDFFGEPSSFAVRSETSCERTSGPGADPVLWWS